MSTLERKRLPNIARPWFAAFAMTLGMSAMAFAAYMVENPHAFTDKTLPIAAAPPESARVLKSEPSPAPVQNETPVIVLDEMRIASHAVRPLTHQPVRSDASAPTAWRSLATGPATRQVRDSCPIPGEDTIQPKLSSNPNTGATERLNFPRTPHERVGSIERPSLHHSLNDTLPSS